MADHMNPGDRVLGELLAGHAELERALGPAAPLVITPEVRSIAAAVERVGAPPALVERLAAPAPLTDQVVERELAGAFGRVGADAARFAAQPSPGEVARARAAGGEPGERAGGQPADPADRVA